MIKVVWICMFANEEVAQWGGINSEIDFAPWIKEMIDLFHSNKEVELHVIAPNHYNNKNIVFKKGGITFYLYSCYPWPRVIPKRIKNFSYNYKRAKKSTTKIIEEINPDLIHLHGSENPISAVVVLPFLNKYPILVTIQGFVFLSSKKNNPIKRLIRRNRVKIERIVNENVTYFSVNSADDEKIIRSFSNDAVIFRSFYPTRSIEVDNDPKKKIYDIVYFGRITKDKGIEDLLMAVKLIKKIRNQVSVIIIGGGSQSYVNYINSLVDKYKLKDNVFLSGYKSSKQELFQLVAKARVSVLPTYFDNFPGTIRESMRLGIPIVATDIEGISFLNNEKECLTLFKKGDIDDLVNKILLVLDNEKRSAKLVQNAFELITEQFDNNKIYSNFLYIYKTILDKRNV